MSIIHVRKLQKFLKIFYFYIAFVGIFGFSLFIAEETMQICMWGNFAAQDAGRYDLVKDNIELIEDTNKTFRFINKYFMWINPFQYWSYGAWSKGCDNYNASLQSLILAKEPSLYIGESVQDISFVWKSYKRGKNNLFILKNQKIKVLLKTMPTQQRISVSGQVRADPQVDGGIIIDPQYFAAQ